MARSNFSSLLAKLLVMAGFVMAGATAHGGNVNLTFDAGEYRVVQAADGQQMIEMDGFNYTLEPGKPMLPVQTYLVAIPPGAEVISVSFRPMGTVELSGTYRIQPARAFMPDNYDAAMMQRCRRIWQDNFNATYASDASYPADPGKFLGTGGLRKYSLARISYFPFSYHPVSGRLEFTPSLDVTVEYREGNTNDPDLKMLMRDTKADKVAANLVVNFQEARHWYAPPELSAPMEEYKTLVIYADGLETQADAFCSGFAEPGDGFATAGHCIPDSTDGYDLADQVRNYVNEKMVQHGIEYLVLMGDIDEIPMRMCFPEPTYHYPGSDYCPPTDYYYADLTGDWDSDGDGYHGEYGEDNVDFIPELHVGRIPYNDPTTVQSIVDKLIAFQYDQDPWKSNALLLGAILRYENEDNDGLLRTDGAELMQSMISGMPAGFTYTTEYEQAGLDPCPYPCDLPLSHTNAVGEWSAGDFGIVNWWGHGSQYSTYRKYWNSDDGDGIPEASEIFMEAFIGTGDVNSLDNTHPSIVFSCSCNNGWPEYNNLAKNLLRNGSAGIVASTRVSWSSAGWTGPSWGGNASIDYYFFDALINGPADVGSALTSSRIYYYNHFMYWGWASAQNLYNFNLYGAPQTVREGLIGSCCDIRGDTDGSGQLDPLDITFLVDYFWKGGVAPDCEEEADVDGNGQVDALDLTYLVEYVWKGGPPPPACQ